MKIETGVIRFYLEDASCVLSLAIFGNMLATTISQDRYEN